MMEVVCAMKKHGLMSWPPIYHTRTRLIVILSKSFCQGAQPPIQIPKKALNIMVFLTCALLY